MKILYTGFKGSTNSSYLLVSRFQGDKIFLTNSFSGLHREIFGLSADYDLIFMFGLDKRLRESVRIEGRAELDGNRIDSGLDSAEVCKSLRSRAVMCSLSYQPTHYLCNAAYYHMLKKFHRRALFLHIPSAGNLSEKSILSILSVLNGQTLFVCPRQSPKRENLKNEWIAVYEQKT